ncbi:MAG: aspartate-semialdehyde dehydrogenase [Bacteroidales bacterium]|nr:aspartate-semialdehyde dehydrogenase [Bacteroidales bacterium]
MKIAVVGATGLVGRNMLRVLQERNFPVTELIPVASEKSSGSKIEFNGKEYTVCTPAQAIEKRPAIALFSAGSGVSKEWAPEFAKAGCRVIDNSACWRMDPTKKLVIPEINGDVLEKDDYIIANPNCSTIQMLVAIADLHKRFRIKRIVVSTYQCITGTGKKAVDQMSAEREGKESPVQAYPYRIDLNLLPHIDVFLENGYTKEEMKMVNETRKIMRDESIRVSPTAIRVPVLGGHAESINLEFAKSFEMEEIFETLRGTAGVVVQDAVAVENGEQPQAIGSVENLPYPMPLFTKDRDEVFVGRIRRDPSLENGINLWCVADNLRKGAATNAVQIAELLIKKGLV